MQLTQAQDNLLVEIENQTEFFTEMISAVKDWTCGRFCRFDDAVAHNFGSGRMSNYCKPPPTAYPPPPPSPYHNPYPPYGYPSRCTPNNRCNYQAGLMEKFLHRILDKPGAPEQSAYSPPYGQGYYPG